jgi:hypothetical protein
MDKACARPAGARVPFPHTNRVFVFMNTCSGHGWRSGTIAAVTEPLDIPLHEQLEEIRTQLAWVRDYL